MFHILSHRGGGLAQGLLLEEDEGLQHLLLVAEEDTELNTLQKGLGGQGLLEEGQDLLPEGQKDQDHQEEERTV